MGHTNFRRWRWLTIQRRARMIPLGVGWTQTESDGGLVLVWEKHWTKISGFYVNTPWRCIWIQFRRWGKRR